MFEIENTMNNDYGEQMASAGNKDRKQVFFLNVKDLEIVLVGVLQISVSG